MKVTHGQLHPLVDFLASLKRTGCEMLFVCHASYEADRACNATLELGNSDLISNIKHALIIGTSTNLEAQSGYRECFNELNRALMKSPTGRIYPLTFARNDLVGMTKKIHDSVGDVLSAYKGIVVVDASVIPKDRLWMILDYLKRINPILRVFIIYTEPAHYSTEIDPDGWLSKGVKRIVRVPGFNGRQNPSKRSLLILIVGHEKERMEITIKNIEPQKIVLVGQGIQQHGENAPTLPRWIVEQLGVEHSNSVDKNGSIEIGSRDHQGTNEAIQSVYDRFSSEFNVIVSTNGTKLQSLGALFACQKNRAIAAIYAEPQIYNSQNYSVGVGQTWVMGI